MAGSKHQAGFTPAAQRTVARCRRIAAESAPQDSWVTFLVLTLLLDESLASACLIRFGITREWLIAGGLGADVARSAALNDEEAADYSPGDTCSSAGDPLDAINDPLDFTRVLDRAAEIARRGVSDGGVSSANLLLAIVETSDFIRERFAVAGVSADRLRDELLPGQLPAETPLRVEEELILSSNPVGAELRIFDSVADELTGQFDVVWRVVDANLNRAREGVRVLEDYARFIANDRASSLELKSLRHELVSAEQILTQPSGAAAEFRKSLCHRNTVGDVGTSLSTRTERVRQSLPDLIVANCRRVEESLRSLEEFGKLLSADFAEKMKQLRYRTYTVEQSLMTGLSLSGAVEKGRRSESVGAVMEGEQNSRVRRLRQAAVYVLITESACRLPWQKVVEQTLDGGADILQLREKALNDRELLRRSAWIRDACRKANALFIVNDRPDITVAADADGVHVGQEEMSVAESRQILQPAQLVGVSTHNTDQARQAVYDGADYLGVGPVFPSQTKSFDEFPGLEFVRSASQSIVKPWFAIGGVSLENIDLLISAGASAIAVTSAVTGSSEPSDVVKELKRRLTERPAGS